MQVLFISMPKTKKKKFFFFTFHSPSGAREARNFQTPWSSDMSNISN